MKRLNYDSTFMEVFAINVISKSFDKKYSNFIWNKKTDNFDFINIDEKVALEVTTLIPSNIKNVIEYEKALDKNKNPNINKIVDAVITDKKELLMYYGGGMDEIRSLISRAIESKESKRKKRSIKYSRYELCLCIDDGGLFNNDHDFQFIIDEKYLEKTMFSRLFLITSNNFFIIENNCIKEFLRIL